MIKNKFRVIKIDQDSSLPLSYQLSRQLTWMMASGQLEKGEILPNIRDFAAALGINLHTVRAAYHTLKNHRLVTITPKVGTVVLEYTPFLDTYKNDVEKRDLIAVLIPKFSDFYHHILAGIQSQASKLNLIPIVISCNEDPFYAETVFNTLSTANLHGVINISVGFTDAFYQKLKDDNRLSAPLVFVDDFDTPGHRINPDTRGAIEIAVNHLLDLGCKDIALINCPQEWAVGREVMAGYQMALEKVGIPIKTELIYTVPDFTSAAGKFCANAMIIANKIPGAVVAASDDLAIGAMDAFRENGLRIPDDIAVMGYNDIPSAANATPALSTVSVPSFDIGMAAMKLMAKILEGKTMGWENQVFSGKLIIRESCGFTRKKEI